MPIIKEKEFPIFKDKDLERQLTVEGYAIVPFFTKAEIEEMHFLYKTLTPPVTSEKPLLASTHSDDVAFKLRMVNATIEVYKRGVKEWLGDVKIMGANLLSKPGGGRGYTFPHQDWTVVDETIFRSINIWVPLVDTNKQNGAICIVPRSHNLFVSYRGPNVDNQCENIQPFLWQNSICLELKAGEALIYDHRLIHHSDNNFTDTVRLASACAIVPSIAEEFLYYQVEKDGKKWIEGFKTSARHLITNERFSPPNNADSLGILYDYDLSPFTMEDFAELNFGFDGRELIGVKVWENEPVKPALAPTPASLTSRIKQLFSFQKS